MKNMLTKDTFREIKKSKGRFISILIIIALGVAFFVGVKSAPMVMKATADKYYDDYNLMDIRVISTLGLTNDDIDAIRQVEGVEGALGTYSKDVVLNHDSREFVLKTHSLDLDSLEENDENYINRVNVIEGRLPQKSGEVVIENNEELEGIAIGSKIIVESGNEEAIENSLVTNEFTVVGIIETPYYLSFQKGSSSIGNGVIDSYIMIPKQDFKMKEYTEAIVTVEDTKEFNSYKDNYFEVIDDAVTNIEGITDEREELRYNEIIQLLPEEIAKNVPKAEWFILDRNSHYSYMDYGNSAASIEAIARVFPVFFFLVAALVCLTTMTRMVDEQRINIGTFKALGYSKWAIAKKFIVYGLLASLIGSIIGTLMGVTIFPTVVMDAYSMMYVLPKSEMLFDIPLILFATLIAVAVTTLSTYFAVNNELSESPSTLMRPRAPKKGKRILIERIPFIWNRFNFTGKVTVRNIFRYKKRFFMTVFGIAGCTALILTGLGIKDSIEDVSAKQFGDIFKYEMTIKLDNIATEKEKSNVIKYLEDESRIIKYGLIKSETGNVIVDGIEKMVSIIIPSNTKDIEKFIDFRERISEEEVILNNDGAIITEKVASLLDISKGDTIEITSNEKRVSVVVSDITENYIGNSVYLTSEYYEKVFGESVEYNSILIDTEDNIDEDILMKDIIKNPIVASVTSSTDFKENFQETVNSLNYVVLVMIVSAGALAFVVLYNLTNVNISERMREIATIKVLGFYDNEVSAYIYRENIILTLVGTLVGLGLGEILHRFIMVTVELETIMFGRSIHGLSYLIAALLTIAFAALVNYAMYYKLKNVKMVESLKSVD